MTIKRTIVIASKTQLLNFYKTIHAYSFCKKHCWISYCVVHHDWFLNN